METILTFIQNCLAITLTWIKEIVKLPLLLTALAILLIFSPLVLFLYFFYFLFSRWSKKKKPVRMSQVIPINEYERWKRAKL